MNKMVKWLVTLAAALFASAALAQSPRVVLAQPELDQILAPVALYPDSLLSQMLMAATFPRDLAEAASWSRAQGGLRGEQAVRAAEDHPWDPSVISLVAFPDVLAMMDERRDWTGRLGDAFLAQPDQVMNTVQELRARADAAGNLQSSPQLAVQRQGEDYVIEPPSPDYFYVPYYDPRVVYGNWWWSDWPPVYWNPWPGYAYGYGYRGFCWGPRLYLGGGFFFGGFDWGHRYVRYSGHRPWYHHGQDYRGGYRWTRGRDGQDWRGRDGRGQAQALRQPDGRNDNRNFDRGNYQRRGASVASAQAIAPTTTQQGFFKPEDARSTTARPATPRYGGERAIAEGGRGATVRSYTVPREGAAPVQRAERVQQPQSAPVERVHTQRAPVERAVTQRPVPVERAAVQRPVTVERAYTQRAAPVEQRAHVQQGPVERAAPARAPADRAERADSSRDTSPVSRGEGGGRGRDR